MPPAAMAPQDLHLDPLLLVGVVLLAILVTTFLFGLVSQQLYEYSLSGFKDSIRIKIFLGAHYGIVALQSVMLWQLAWSYFIVEYGFVKTRTWQVAVSLVFQCMLVLSANIFLADRIHAMIRCRVQSAVIITLSIFAFAFGVATILLISFGQITPRGTYTRPEVILSAFWHGLQAIAQCLVTYSLIRGHLDSRSGIQKSDGVVYYLVRRVVQTGLLAMIWAILGLVAFIFMPKFCSLFDMTLGSIYTHVIFDTLQSRRRVLPVHLAQSKHLAHQSSQLDRTLTAESTSRTFDGKGSRSSSGAPTHKNVSVLKMANLGPRLETPPQSTFRLSRDNVSEIECAPAGQSGIPYEFSYARFLGEV
ncbi:hypothetical protein V8E53_009093 [Lactarius tabidus]